MSLSHIRRAILPAVVTALVAITGAMPSEASVINVGEVLEWQRRLAEATTANDSIRALYNLFDITLRRDSGVYSMQLVELADREKDYAVELDILRKLSNTADGDSVAMDRLLELVNRVPPSDDQRQTMIFVRMRDLLGRMELMTEEERFRMVNELIQTYRDNPEASLYDRILPLYSVTMALGMTVGGDLYSDYMDRLSLLIKELPDSLGPLNSLFHTQASMIYTMNNEKEKAVAANLKLLSIIEGLKKMNEARGFTYFNYETVEYVALRRLLANYEILSREDVERYYNCILELVEQNPRIAADFNKLQRTQSFYLVATGRYGEAIPVLKKALSNERNANYRTTLSLMLIRSADKAGDIQSARQAREEYIKALEQRLARAELDKIRELQILLEANSHSLERIDELEDDNNATVMSYRIALYAVSALAAVALILLLVIVYRDRLNSRGQRCRHRK